VAGGTGRLAAALVPLLQARGEPVRVLSRNPQATVAPGCELAMGDVREPGDLRDAMAGVTAVVSAMHGFTGGRGAGPEEVDHLGNVHLVDAAAAAGVKRLVLVSVFDARADNPMPLHRAKHAAETYLRSSGLDWTIVRPTAFLETWLMVVGNKTASGGPALVFGRARNPINFVSVRDVAAVVDRALPDPESHGRTLDVVGPENLTMSQLASALGATRIRRIPRPALRVMSVAARPFAPAFARQARTAVVMDTADMTASSPTGSGPHRRLQDVLADRR
jgi:NADH dehydrogenase